MVSVKSETKKYCVIFINCTLLKRGYFLLWMNLHYVQLYVAGFNTNEVVRQITECDYRMPQPPKCPRSLYSIMRSCWSKEPEDRPDFKQLKSDLKKVDRCSELV